MALVFRCRSPKHPTRFSICFWENEMVRITARYQNFDYWTEFGGIEAVFLNCFWRPVKASSVSNSDGHKTGCLETEFEIFQQDKITITLAPMKHEQKKELEAEMTRQLTR